MKLGFTGCAALLVTSLDPALAAIEFNRDIRPILSDKCFICHGPDARAKGVPVRLDIEDEAKAERNGRRAIAPGDPAASLILQRITHEKKVMRMPPAATGLQLTSAEIETLRQWILEGAKWQAHWAFIAPVKTPVPPVNLVSWPRSPIDSFVLARLEKEGLQPSREASREKFLRRASYDLTGLPPAPAEIREFAADRRPDAYERAVDRLLASPRYGERIAARWLDAARYADTNGYQYDGERVMWRWRDYVISSFNRNTPFDQFALEQIAGDMLPNPTFEQRIATGFNRNHRGNTEDGIIPEEYAVEYVVDRVETTSAVFLGLTMGCARCHNHKYDPFTQKEFYRMFAYFNNVPESGRAMKYGNSPPLMLAPTPDQQSTLVALDAKLAGATDQLRAKQPEIDRLRAAWIDNYAALPSVRWAPSRGLDTAIPGQFLGDGERVAADPKAAQFDIDDRWSFSAWIRSDSTPSGTVFSRMARDDPKAKGFGLHVEDGALCFTMTSVWETDAFRARTTAKLSPDRWHHVAVTYAGSKMLEGLKISIDGAAATLTPEADNLYRPFSNAGGKFNVPLRIGGGAGKERRFRGVIEEARFYGRVLSPREIEMLAVRDSVDTVAAKPAAIRSETEKRILEASFLETGAPANIRLVAETRTSLLERREQLERTFPSVMIMAESPVRKKTHILERGAYDKPGELVEPGLPQVLPGLPEGVNNDRLGFARWLVDRRNPLTARVTVNRLWQMLFGAGLVRTVEDFGQQGDWPSHPELLDWLAVEFMDAGWNVKGLLRQIVLSSTYRQDSAASNELLQRDPDNRLLARGPRFRLPAEMIRDGALLSAGLLTERLGGPSVKPYQPDGLWKEVVMQDFDYVQARGPDLYRRSLYTFWKRTAAPPMMMNFDAAHREACVVRENRTNTPLQALNLMNDVTFLEAARFIGQRMILEGGASKQERLKYGFLLVNGREPGDRELEVLLDSLAWHGDYFATGGDRAKQYLSQGDSPSDQRIPRDELAAYAAVASLLLNTDQAVTKE